MRAQMPMKMPDAQQLQRMAARFAPTDITADVSKLSAGRSARAGEIDRGVEDRGRVVSASGLVRQWADADRPRGGPVAGRPRASALLPHQQGSVVAARSQSAVPAWSAGQAGRGELLSRG